MNSPKVYMSSVNESKDTQIDKFTGKKKVPNTYYQIWLASEYRVNINITGNYSY